MPLAKGKGRCTRCRKAFTKSVLLAHQLGCDYRICSSCQKSFRRDNKHVCNKRKCPQCNERYNQDSVHLCEKLKCSRCTKTYEKETIRSCNMRSCSQFYKKYDKDTEHILYCFSCEQKVSENSLSCEKLKSRFKRSAPRSSLLKLDRTTSGARFLESYE